MLGIFFLYIRFVFAWFSRRFEREADLFSAELLKDFRPLSRGLERIGLACGNIRNEASWHHYGIAERVWFLQESYYNGIFRKSFKRKVRYLRLCAIVMFIALLSNTAYTFLNVSKHPTTSKQRPLQKSIAIKDNMRNWQEIDAILGQDGLAQPNSFDKREQSKEEPES